MRQHRRQWDRGFRQGGYITGTIDTRHVDKFISELRNGKQGRRLIRNASRVALELFNEETGSNARELDLNAPVRAVRARVTVLHRELHAVRDRIPLRRGDYRCPLRHDSAPKTSGQSRERLEPRCAAIGARSGGAHVKGNLIS